LLGAAFLPWGLVMGACILLGASCVVGTGGVGTGAGASDSVDWGLAFGDGSSFRNVLVNAESIGDGVGARLLDGPGLGGAVVGTAEGAGAGSGGALSALPAA